MVEGEGTDGRWRIWVGGFGLGKYEERNEMMRGDAC